MFQKIPFRVVLSLLEYHRFERFLVHFAIEGGQSDEELMKYFFGYFSKDRTRKIFLIWKALYSCYEGENLKIPIGIKFFFHGESIISTFVSDLRENVRIHLQSTESLIFDDFYQDNRLEEKLSTLLAKYPKTLKKLRINTDMGLSKNDIGDLDLSKIFPELENLKWYTNTSSTLESSYSLLPKTLKKLSLWVDGGSRQVFPKLDFSVLKRLENIKILGYSMSSDTFTTLNNETLRRITFENVKFSRTVSFNVFLKEEMRHLTNLSHLTFDVTTFRAGTEMTTVDSDCLKRFTKLQHLKLFDVGVKTKKPRTMFFSLKNFLPKTLETFINDGSIFPDFSDCENLGEIQYDGFLEILQLQVADVPTDPQFRGNENSFRMYQNLAKCAYGLSQLDRNVPNLHRLTIISQSAASTSSSRFNNFANGFIHLGMLKKIKYLKCVGPILLFRGKTAEQHLKHLVIINNHCLNDQSLLMDIPNSLTSLWTRRCPMVTKKGMLEKLKFMQWLSYLRTDVLKNGEFEKNDCILILEKPDVNQT